MSLCIPMSNATLTAWTILRAASCVCIHSLQAPSVHAPPHRPACAAPPSQQALDCGCGGAVSSCPHVAQHAMAGEWVGSGDGAMHKLQRALPNDRILGAALFPLRNHSSAGHDPVACMCCLSHATSLGGGSRRGAGLGQPTDSHCQPSSWPEWQGPDRRHERRTTRRLACHP